MAHGLCERHLAAQRRHDDQRRGTAAERGYDDEHEKRFRRPVLMRDRYVCVVCGRRASVADHHPRSRRQLIAAGNDPNDPRYGRALCKPCHDTHTGHTEGAGNLGRTRIRDR